MNKTPIPLAWCGDQADFTRMMIALANQRQLAMRGMSKRAAFHYVETIVADAEVVIGVWQDPSEPNGVGLHVIKGLRQVMTATASGEPPRVRVDAVPCIDREQAVAAEQRFGDKPN
jgi:hypothetical protein